MYKYVGLVDLIRNMKQNIIDLAANGMLNMEFHLFSVDAFWIKTEEEYPGLAFEAVKGLLP